MSITGDNKFTPWPSAELVDVDPIKFAELNAKDEPPVEQDHKTVVCYNSSCPDYRVPRTDGSKCSCQRTKVKGAGDWRNY